VHIAKDVKEHCRTRNIELIVIPGGLTSYFQAVDIGFFRELKDKISSIIDEWRRSNHVQYTKVGNPKPPQQVIKHTPVYKTADDVVRSWVLDAWRSVLVSTSRTQ
jgi:hypothetical protein